MITKLKKKAADIVLGKDYHELEALTQFRLLICRACPRFKPAREECGLCGCFMDVKAKMSVNINPKTRKAEITHCPEGRWGDQVIAKLYKN